MSDKTKKNRFSRIANKAMSLLAMTYFGANLALAGIDIISNRASLQGLDFRTKDSQGATLRERTANKLASHLNERNVRGSDLEGSAFYYGSHVQQQEGSEGAYHVHPAWMQIVPSESFEKTPRSVEVHELGHHVYGTMMNSVDKQDFKKAFKDYTALCLSFPDKFFGSAYEKGTTDFKTGNGFLLKRSKSALKEIGSKLVGAADANSLSELEWEELFAETYDFYHNDAFSNGANKSDEEYNLGRTWFREYWSARCGVFQNANGLHGDRVRPENIDLVVPDWKSLPRLFLSYSFERTPYTLKRLVSGEEIPTD